MSNNKGASQIKYKLKIDILASLLESQKLTQNSLESWSHNCHVNAGDPVLAFQDSIFRGSLDIQEI